MDELLQDGWNALAGGDLPRAEAIGRQLVQGQPVAAEPLILLGQVALAARQAPVAVKLFDRARAIDPQNLGVWEGLGLALQEQGAQAEALIALSNAYLAGSRRPPVLAALVRHLADNAISINMANGQRIDALSVAKDLFAGGRTVEPDALAIVGRALLAAPVDHSNFPPRAMIDQLLQTPLQLPPFFELPLSQALAFNLIAEGRIGPDGALTLPDLAEWAEDQTLNRLLTLDRLMDPRLERAMAELRLRLAQLPELELRPLLAFATSLAIQCHHNEHLWPLNTPDKAIADQAGQALADSAARGAADEVALICWALFRPLGAHPARDVIASLDWPDGPMFLVREQILFPTEERQAAAAMPVHSLAGPGSLEVAAMYEENPYPRWASLPPAATPRHPARLIADICPGAAVEQLATRKPVKLLIAGCGTGRQVAAALQAYDQVDITAVDISGASLGYAARMLKKFGLGPVRFVRADLRDLDENFGKFDLIESTGVLHHLDDPEFGLARLAQCLAPGGFMRIALYSRRARRKINEARALAARWGVDHRDDPVRSFRARVAADPDQSELHHYLTRQYDYYSVSDCRDMLFHVQEHQFGPLDIEAMIARIGLVFTGMELPATLAQSKLALAAPSNLAAWDVIEQTQPEMFSGMFFFWLCRP